MTLIENGKFRFVSDALPPETFAVLRFQGAEALSRPYRFEIGLMARDADIDLKAVLRKACRLSIPRPEGDLLFHGVLTSFDQMQQVRGLTFYRAVMTPRLERLKFTRHNQVFLGRSAPEIVQSVLKDGGLTASDFRFETDGPYGPWDYACQYRETHFEFVSRWMERVGLYYFFEQGDGAEVVVLTDTARVHQYMPQGRTLEFVPPSGLTGQVRTEVIHALVCSQNAMPHTVRLKDYNYATPTLEIEGEAEVSPDGTGTVYIYGEHFMNDVQGANLARIRAEEIRSRERVFHGESQVPYLRPGYVFDLTGHYRKDFNISYLTVGVEHFGDQTSLLPGEFRSELGLTGDAAPVYRNSFTLIPAGVQFRPERKTEKPRFYSTLNAKIDAEGTGSYAELDDHGRYKVRLPFDLGDHPGGKASSWLRMAQPYAGQDYGQHFPLHKGTEVLLTFIDGDPDRPIINAAVPNWETRSPVVDANETLNVIQTAAGNRLEMQDQAEEERIRLGTPKEDSFLQLGAPGGANENMVLSTRGSGLIRTGRYLKTETGAARTEGAPYDGDNYLSVERDQVETVGRELHQTVKGSASYDIGGMSNSALALDVKVTGGHQEHVQGAQFLNVDGAQTRKIGGERQSSIGGNDTLTVGGDQKITIKGKQKVKIEGKNEHVYHSEKREIYSADKIELYASGAISSYMSGKLEIYAALTASFYLAVKLEMYGSDSWKFSLARSFEASAGSKISIFGGADIKASYGVSVALHEAVKVDYAKIKAEQVEAKLQQCKIKLQKNDIHILD